MAQSRTDRVGRIYYASDADATRALYADLEARGLLGIVAMNLLRAHKASSRAKVYRGGNKQGRYAAQAYEKKEWSPRQLCLALTAATSLRWGWEVDPNQEMHKHILYIDLPTGQVSFHTGARLAGPDYTGVWDGIRGVGAERIITWAESILTPTTTGDRL